MPDTRRVNDNPDETAPSHSDAPKDVRSEVQVSNLADLMDMPIFESAKSDFDQMPLSTAPPAPALPLTKSHSIPGPA
eukprot:5817979-Pyramimonas_sp.AAC.1